MPSFKSRALVLMIVLSKYVLLSRIRVPKSLEKSASLTGGATLTARNIRAATRVLFASQKAGGRRANKGLPLLLLLSVSTSFAISCLLYDFSGICGLSSQWCCWWMVLRMRIVTGL